MSDTKTIQLATRTTHDILPSAGMILFIQANFGA